MSRRKKRPPLPQLSPGLWLADSHCHLDMEPLSQDLPEVLRRAREARIGAIISVGIDGPSSQAASNLALQHQEIYAAVGIHPHHACDYSPALAQQFAKLTDLPKVVAYGEIGIDCYKNYAPLARQIACFRWQLILAQEQKLPVIIHDREAHQEVYDILKEIGPFPNGGIIHCFSGDEKWAEFFLDLGFHLSIPGVVTFAKAETLQKAAAMIPLDRLLVETDGPFLAPEPWRGKTNEPAFTLYTAAKIAELKQLSLDEIAQATSDNLAKLLAIEVGQ